MFTVAALGKYGYDDQTPVHCRSMLSPSLRDLLFLSNVSLIVPNQLAINNFTYDRFVAFAIFCCLFVCLSVASAHRTRQFKSEPNFNHCVVLCPACTQEDKFDPAADLYSLPFPGSCSPVLSGGKCVCVCMC